MRAHNRAKRASDDLSQQRSSRKQEKAFKRNPWKFSKSVCDAQNAPSPTFSMAKFLDYFQSAYSGDMATYDGLPAWINDVMPVPSISSDFDMSAISPRIIKRTLQKCSPDSSPGPDRISYLHLRNLPCVHHFLATLFSKFLFECQEAPCSWYQAKIILTLKGGDPSMPGKFHP